MAIESFENRHIGTIGAEKEEMLNSIGISNIDELISQTIPDNIRLKNPINVPSGVSEFEYTSHINALAKENKLFKSFIGLGYYGTITPAVIQRNILENPGWYTAYTPYQAEISQGRLEGLLNFQTMVSDLTGMELANASLLDEGTAAAEAMIMLFNSRSRTQSKAGIKKFFVSDGCFPQTIDVLITRATPLNIELVFGDPSTTLLNEEYFGAIIQFPDKNGNVRIFSEFINSCKQNDVKIVVAADLMSLALLTPPGEWGADVVVGNTQRFGVPMGFGGPHAGYFATHESFKRNIPGRIIGVSTDKNGNRGLRMALQTREQHIRRDKATSNICTAQALLAVMAGMYAVYHGPDGIKNIAIDIHSKAASLKITLEKNGVEILNSNFFDTLHVKSSVSIKKTAIKNEINFNYISENDLTISIDETTSVEDLQKIADCFGNSKVELNHSSLPTSLARKSEYLTHPVFNSYHSESEMMRYLKHLENKDISLTHSMISLGSCTMKLNAASELFPISIPEFANLHPFVPSNQAIGYQKMIDQLEEWLCAITGFAAVSFQPNSGAQGEYTGLLVIQAFHQNNGEVHRNIALIPSSAHGTNPASAVMAGLKVVVVKCDEDGNIDINDLREKAELHKENLSALMVTYPSTHGVFETGIKEITEIIHQNGGQVYMDGANMNAQVGLTNPAEIGGDVCHLNLHKTFAIPHGGGGPGVGPIGVASHLAPFLPGHNLIKTGGENAIHSVSAAPWGSALILLISYGYIKMLGFEGLTNSTKHAILNANYMKQRLANHFSTLYAGNNGRVAHEMIIDCRDFKKTSGVEVEYIAKRLIDYGFHAPTVSFPVAGTLMIEPTESESKAELDRFCDALIEIRKEIEEIENGISSQEDNVLKNAPHSANELMSNEWNHTYSREKAGFPLNYLRRNKYWPCVSRIDNASGDRNLICTCPPIENYQEESIEA